MPGGQRKKPFSGKQKKQQLQTKKNKPTAETFQEFNFSQQDSEGRITEPKQDDQNNPSTTGSKFFDRRHAPTRMDTGRYALIFREESKGEIMKSKEEARKKFHSVREEYLECEGTDFFTPQLDFPVRPAWDYRISRAELEKNENRYFNDYLQKIDATFERSELSYFELNLETWRQFWRVLEMSDILLCVVDIRFPPLLFPPKLYDYVVNDLKKYVILVMNKIDLAPPALVLAWRDHFVEKYPGLEVLCFTSYPSVKVEGSEKSSLLNRKRRGKLRMAAEGAMELYKVCEKIVQGQANLDTWKTKILEEMNAEEDEEDEKDVKIIDAVDTSKPDVGFHEFKKFDGGLLTIGCLGQPNVGKSSLINALMGKKVVSVSKTPGHTKHFQTIFLTKTVRLCDCPGLVFPSKVPKPLQVLSGCYPIAQLRDPFSTVRYLGERLNLPAILGIHHPEGEYDWSAYDIADGWAEKRGYRTAKTSRLDSYRGANHILRLALDGRICLNLRPTGYLKNKERYQNDPRVADIKKIQAKSTSSTSVVEIVDMDEDISDEEEETNHTDEDDVGQGNTKTTSGNNSKAILNLGLKNKFSMLCEDNDDED